MIKNNIPFYQPNGQNTPGFLLIELVLTILLVSGLGFYLCGWYSQLININRESVNRSQAINLACSLCETYRLNKNISKENLVGNNIFDVSYEIKKFDSKFSFIEIKVSWDSCISNKFNKKSFVEFISGRAL